MHVKDLSHSAERIGGRLQLNTHVPYVTWLCMKWSDMVHGSTAWCTQNAPIWPHGTSRVTTKQRCNSHHFGGYSKHTIKCGSRSLEITYDKRAASLLGSGDRAIEKWPAKTTRRTENMIVYNLRRLIKFAALGCIIHSNIWQDKRSG